jgi:hypothetical protein
MDLMTRLDLELQSCRRVEKVLEWMRHSLDFPDKTAEYRETLEILQIKKERIAFLQARLAAGQT